MDITAFNSILWAAFGAVISGIIGFIFGVLRDSRSSIIDIRLKTFDTLNDCTIKANESLWLIDTTFLISPFQNYEKNLIRFRELQKENLSIDFRMQILEQSKKAIDTKVCSLRSYRTLYYKDSTSLIHKMESRSAFLPGFRIFEDIIIDQNHAVSHIVDSIDETYLFSIQEKLNDSKSICNEIALIESKIDLLRESILVTSGYYNDLQNELFNYVMIKPFWVKKKKRKPSNGSKVIERNKSIPW